MKKTLLILLALVSLSCEKELDDILPPFESRIVVNSIIRPDTVVTVFLSNSISILSEETPAPIPGANVRLLENGVFIGMLSDTTIANNADRFIEPLEGFYYMDYLPVPGATYTLEVEHPEYPTVSATTTIPRQSSNFSVSLSEPEVINYNNEEGWPSQVRYTATITIEDAPGNNFYELAVISEFPDRYYIYDEDNFPLEERRVMVLREIFYTSNDPVYDQTQNPVFEDDQNDVFYFFASNPAFDDNLFSGQTYSIDITFDITVGPLFYSSGTDGITIEEVAERFFVEVRSLSQELYQYDFTTLKQSSTSKDPFAEPVQIYTNVENGLGIFGGYNIELFEFSLEEFIP